jgi:hypothetical protein
MVASTFSLVPLSTYNLKDFLNSSPKLPPFLLQKEFSMQMSSAMIGIKIVKDE